MSRKFLFGVLLPAILILAATLFLKQHFSGARTPDVATVPTPPVTETLETASMPLPPAPTPVTVAARQLTLEEKQAAMAAEEDRLYTWGMSSDPQSLSNILADLDSPEKEIRMAAIEAAKQFRNTNAIPVLKAAAVKTDDNEEMAALLDAVQFISLPPGGFSSGGTLLTPEQKQAARRRHDQWVQQQQTQNSGGNPSSQPGYPPSQAPNQNQGNPPAQGQGQP
jgi:hypothetical protein